MGKNITTIVKIFLLFLVFQVSINFMVEILPDVVPNYTGESETFMDFVSAKVNGKLNAESQGESLLTNFENSMETENLFNDSIIDSFLGVLQVIGSVIRFLIQLALSILFTPTIITEILIYNFVGTSALIFSMALISNIFFYMTLFYIVFKRRVES